MKKLFALGFAALLSLGLSGCNKDNSSTANNALDDLSGTYDITVWMSETEGVKELTEKQIKAFDDMYENITINATVEQVSEAESATQMINDVESGADIFAFAQDQLARLVTAGALNPLGKAATQTVTDLNDAGAVKAATVNEKVYCYPLTSDNGYFMFYDKSVVKESSLDSFEAIIADCEAAGKNFSYELETSGWYNAGFFFATGCVSEWTTDNDGKFTSVKDTFNSDAGVVALKGMQKLLKSSSYVSSSQTTDFGAAIPSAVVISGTWGAKAAQEALGENFGATDLPSFTVDGNSYHLGSFSGNKLLGVKPSTDAKRAAVLQQLALYLTNATCQLERFETTGWGPSNLEAQANDAIKADVSLNALAQQSTYAIPQGQIHGSWWDLSKVYAASAKIATTDDELRAALAEYEASIKALFNMSEDEKNAWSVIGSMNGDGWTTDIEMEKVDDTTWITKEAITFVAGDEFKVRQGKNWDVSYGDGAANYVVAEAGTFYVKAVFTYDADGNATGATITLETSK